MVADQTDITTPQTNGPRRRGGVPGNRGGQPGRSGPPGNGNAMRHGLYSVGKLPKGSSYLRRLLGRLQSALEAAVVAKHGEVTITQSAIISAVLRHEMRAALCQRYLRAAEEEPAFRETQSRSMPATDGGAPIRVSKATGLSLQDRLGLLREIGQATDARDRALERLRLDDDGGKASVWDAIYARTIPAVSQPTNGHDGRRTGPLAAADAGADSEAGHRAPNAGDASVEDDAGEGGAS